MKLTVYEAIDDANQSGVSWWVSIEIHLKYPKLLPLVVIGTQQEYAMNNILPNVTATLTVRHSSPTNVPSITQYSNSGF